MAKKLLFKKKITVVVKPLITSVSPSTGLNLAGLDPVLIVGQNFIQSTTVTIGGDPISNRVVIDSTHISGLAPAKSNAGAYDVTVSDGRGSSTLISAITYIPEVAPPPEAVGNLIGPGPNWDGTITYPNRFVPVESSILHGSGFSRKVIAPAIDIAPDQWWEHGSGDLQLSVPCAIGSRKIAYVDFYCEGNSIHVTSRELCPRSGTYGFPVNLSAALFAASGKDGPIELYFRAVPENGYERVGKVRIFTNQCGTLDPSIGSTVRPLTTLKPAGQGGTYSTLYEAICKVASGEVVDVYPGTYTETCNYPFHDIITSQPFKRFLAVPALIRALSGHGVTDITIQRAARDQSGSQSYFPILTSPIIFKNLYFEMHSLGQIRGRGNFDISWDSCKLEDVNGANPPAPSYSYLNIPTSLSINYDSIDRQEIRNHLFNCSIKYYDVSMFKTFVKCTGEFSADASQAYTRQMLYSNVRLRKPAQFKTRQHDDLYVTVYSKVYDATNHYCVTTVDGNPKASTGWSANYNAVFTSNPTLMAKGLIPIPSQNEKDLSNNTLTSSGAAVTTALAHGLVAGRTIKVGSQYRTVDTVVDTTHFTINTAFSSDFSTATAYIALARFFLKDTDQSIYNAMQVGDTFWAAWDYHSDTYQEAAGNWYENSLYHRFYCECDDPTFGVQPFLFNAWAYIDSKGTTFTLQSGTATCNVNNKRITFSQAHSFVPGDQIRIGSTSTYVFAVISTTEIATLVQLTGTGVAYSKLECVRGSFSGISCTTDAAHNLILGDWVVLYYENENWYDHPGPEYKEVTKVISSTQFEIDSPFSVPVQVTGFRRTYYTKDVALQLCFWHGEGASQSGSPLRHVVIQQTSFTNHNLSMNGRNSDRPIWGEDFMMLESQLRGYGNNSPEYTMTKLENSHINDNMPSNYATGMGNSTGDPMLNVDPNNWANRLDNTKTKYLPLAGSPLWKAYTPDLMVDVNGNPYVAVNGKYPIGAIGS